MGTGLLEQENLWEKADGSRSHTAFIPVIELPRIPAECLKIRMTEIQAVLENDLYEGENEEKELLEELETLKKESK